MEVQALILVSACPFRQISLAKLALEDPTHKFFQKQKKWPGSVSGIPGRANLPGANSINPPYPEGLPREPAGRRLISFAGPVKAGWSARVLSTLRSTVRKRVLKFRDKTTGSGPWPNIPRGFSFVRPHIAVVGEYP